MVQKRLPPLNWLRSFEASARHLSFTGAAAELHITQSAVSQQVKLLENYLGEGLFRRQARGLQLTDAGKNYLPIVTEAFLILQQGTQSFFLPNVKANLEIKANTAFSVLWLMPRIGSFLKTHPDIGLNLSTALLTSDYEGSGAVVEIRYGHGEWEGVKGERLIDQEIYPVCSPALAETLTAPQDLDKVPLIHVLQLVEDWDLWMRGVGIDLELKAVGHAVNTFVLSLEFAQQGLGVALAHDLLAGRPIERGDLVIPFNLRVPARDSYYLITAPAAENDPQVQAFRAWLMNEIQTTHPSGAG